jgi:hypothetical protein
MLSPPSDREPNHSDISSREVRDLVTLRTTLTLEEGFASFVDACVLRESKNSDKH